MIRASLKKLLDPAVSGSSMMEKAPELARLLSIRVSPTRAAEWTPLEQGICASKVVAWIVSTRLDEYTAPQLMAVLGLEPWLQGMPLMRRYEVAGDRVRKENGLGINGSSYRTHRLPGELTRLAAEVYGLLYLEPHTLHDLWTSGPDSESIAPMLAISKVVPHT